MVLLLVFGRMKLLLVERKALKIYRAAFDRVLYELSLHLTQGKYESSCGVLRLCFQLQLAIRQDAKLGAFWNEPGT